MDIPGTSVMKRPLLVQNGNSCSKTVNVEDPKFEKTVTSHYYRMCSEKNNTVLLTSSMPHSPVADLVSEKLEIIFYNITKGGVDELDKKCSIYSCRRRTPRWPMRLFYLLLLLDISTVNSYANQQIISESTSDDKGVIFKDLACQLVLKYVQRRAQNPRVTFDNTSHPRL
ncbi:hypothetical protein C0J52_12884 [Blattella germanica]|nr:hypothetical protein C0J52_12884 [Blattella germanica]